MLKPPSSTIPGMTDTLDFVKNLWGSMHLPGSSLPGMAGIAGPALSMEDLDKRIADMKAVESWLNLNLTMLRGTIQALEVQRGTLATLRTMGASMAEAMRQSGVSAENLAATPFASFFAPPAAAKAPGAAAAPSAPAPPQAAAPATPGGMDAAAGGPAQPGTAAPAGHDAAAASAAAAMGMPAAMAWWNMLQDQFTQAVNVALAPQGAAAPDAPAKPEAPRADAQPAAEARVPEAPPRPKVDGTVGADGNGKARASRTKADRA